MDGFKVLITRVLAVERFFTNWTDIVHFLSRVKFIPVNSVSYLAFKSDLTKTTILFKSLLVNLFVVSEEAICAVETF